MDVLDLTRPLLSAPVWREGAYADPVPEVSEWCAIAERGFRVQRLSLGTQSGTHIDAPAHFVAGGATLEALPAAALVGRYFHLAPQDLADAGAVTARLTAYAGEPILFLIAPETAVAETVLDRLIALGAPVWVLAGALAIASRPPTHANLRLAEAGIFLVEDLDEAAAARAPRTGLIAALPLRLTGVTGSPCRVVAVPDPADRPSQA